VAELKSENHDIKAIVKE